MKEKRSQTLIIRPIWYKMVQFALIFIPVFNVSLRKVLFFSVWSGSAFSFCRSMWEIELSLSVVEKWQTLFAHPAIFSSNIICTHYYPVLQLHNCLHTPVDIDFILKNRILITHQKILSNNALINTYLDKLVQRDLLTFFGTKLLIRGPDKKHINNVSAL
jgi:hypothetical protein